MDRDDLIKKSDINAIVNKGTKIYERIKKKYEPKHTGKFLAIEVESGDAYLADWTSDAVEKAMRDYPDKVFYVVKIGSSAAETLARLRDDQL